MIVTKKKLFKNLFKKSKTIDLSLVLEKLEFENCDILKNNIKKWKLGPFFDLNLHLKPQTIVRNEIPFFSEKFFTTLKKTGKWTLKRSIPIAISMVTGNIGLGATVTPIVNDIITKFKDRKLIISQETHKYISDVITSGTDVAIDSLIQKLKDDNSSEYLINKIKLCVNEELFPYISEFKEVINQLENQKENLYEILEIWIEEQKERILSYRQNKETELIYISKIENELLNPLSDKYEKDLGQFHSEMVQTSKQISSISRKLNRMEDKMESIFHEVVDDSLTSLSLPELLQISSIQFKKVKLAGKYGYPFSQDLFIQTPVLDMNFRDFLNQKGGVKPIFLLLANIGLGKTWNAIHLGIMSHNEETTIPFYIPIHLGYENLLKEIFNVSGTGFANKIGQKCVDLERNVRCKVLFIFDGFDEYPIENRQPFINFLNQLLLGYGQSIFILMTDRLMDWCRNNFIRRFHKDIISLIFTNPSLEKIRKDFKTVTPLSGYLTGFTDNQLDNAIQKYKMEYNKFPPKLYDLCHRPYLLRLILEIQKYPDPDKPNEFFRIFWNEESPLNTILYRMNIIGTAEDFFIRLIEFFGSSTVKKNEKELQSLIENYKNEWYIVLLSGIILEERKGIRKEYIINPIFASSINEFLKRVIEPQTDETGEISSNREDTKWSEKLSVLLDQNLQDFAIRPFLNTGTYEQKKKFLSTFIQQKPPSRLDKIYNVCRLFHQEINEFFSKEINLQYFDVIFENNDGDQLREIDSNLAKSWSILRTQKWPKNLKDILQLISEIFSLNDDVSEKLLKSKFISEVKFVDEKWNIEADNEEERIRLIKLNEVVQRKKELEEKKRLELEEKKRLEFEEKKRLELEEKERLELEEKERLELEEKERLELEENIKKRKKGLSKYKSKKKQKNKNLEQNAKIGFNADQKEEIKQFEEFKIYSGESEKIQYEYRSGDIIETYDSASGKKEGVISLGSNGAEGKLVMLELLEKIEYHYEFNAETDIEEDRKTSGVFKIKNPSDSDEIWEIKVTFKKNKDNDVGLDDEIYIKNLDPDEEKELEYDIEQFEEPALEISECISTINDENTLSYTLSTGDENKVLFKLILKNLMDYPLKNVVIKKEILDGYSEIDILGSSLGSTDKDSEFIKWKIDTLSANAEAELKLNMSIQIEDSSSKIRSGKISAEYYLPYKSLSGIEIDKFDAYSNNFVGLLIEQQDDNPDAYDCSVMFMNESEFQVQIVNLDVINRETDEKVIDVDPNEIPVIAAGATWTSVQWETETDDGIEPMFNKIVEFFLISSRKVSTIGKIVIDDIELAVAAIAGKLDYSLEQIMSYRITPFDALLQVKNTGGADLNEI
ncbi:MAG: hypothetical protein ACTSVL_01130, partial [Promethearchaeota archaeon]